MVSLPMAFFGLLMGSFLSSATATSLLKNGDVQTGEPRHPAGGLPLTEEHPAGVPGCVARRHNQTVTRGPYVAQTRVVQSESSTPSRGEKQLAVCAIAIWLSLSLAIWSVL
jgi:hypothetical protein